MADEFGVTESAAEEGSIGGTEELGAFSKETLASYISRFQLHQSNLNSLNVYFNTSASASENTTVIDQAKAINNAKSIIYDSRKGGGGVAPIEENLKAAQDSVANAIQEQVAQNNLRDVRNGIEYNKQTQALQRTMLEIGRDVYKLKQEVTGVTEQFAFMYRGNNKSAISVVTVPVNQFFNAILNIPDINKMLVLEQRSGGFNTWSLRFNSNKSTLRNILGQLADMNGASSFDISSILDRDGNSINAMQLYKRERGATQGRVMAYGKLRKKEKEAVDKGKGQSFNNAQGIYREDPKGYWIVNRNSFQTGFIAQEIFNAFMNETTYNYQTDRIAWYKGEDVTGKNGIGYSVKSFLEQTPTLYAVSSLNNALTEIITALTTVQNLDLNSIKSYLKSAVFSAASEIGAAFSSEMSQLPLLNGSS